MREPSNPVGKVLIIDKILSVAATAVKRVSLMADRAHDFVRNAALALGRDTIRKSTSAVSASATDFPSAGVRLRQPTFRFALVTVFPLLGRQ